MGSSCSIVASCINHGMRFQRSMDVWKINCTFQNTKIGNLWDTQVILMHLLRKRHTERTRWFKRFKKLIRTHWTNINVQCQKTWKNICNPGLQEMDIGSNETSFYNVIPTIRWFQPISQLKIYQHIWRYDPFLTPTSKNKYNNNFCIIYSFYGKFQQFTISRKNVLQS